MTAPPHGMSNAPSSRPTHALRHPTPRRAVPPVIPTAHPPYGTGNAAVGSVQPGQHARGEFCGERS
jgi:hypothetical protein